MELFVYGFLTKWGGWTRFRLRNNAAYYDYHKVLNDWDSFFLYALFCLAFLAIAAMLGNVPFLTFPKNPCKWHIHLLLNTEYESKNPKFLNLWWLSSILLWTSVLCLILALTTLASIFLQ